MKHLIIFAHPNQDSLNGALKQAIFEYLTNKGDGVVVRDLYEIGFNPVFSLEDLKNQRNETSSQDVKIEQEFISWADSIIFIYPIWWAGLPAMIKGYIDRVFSYGFAYRYDQGVQKGLLAGKQATIVNTLGKSLEEYGAIGMDTALSTTAEIGIYKYCGLEINKHFFFDKAHKSSKERIDNWIKGLKEVF